MAPTLTMTHIDVGAAAAGLGRMLMAEGDTEGAQHLLETALTAMAAALGDTHGETIATKAALAGGSGLNLN